MFHWRILSESRKEKDVEKMEEIQEVEEDWERLKEGLVSWKKKDRRFVSEDEGKGCIGRGVVRWVVVNCGGIRAGGSGENDTCCWWIEDHQEKPRCYRKNSSKSQSRKGS